MQIKGLSFLHILDFLNSINQPQGPGVANNMIDDNSIEKNYLGWENYFERRLGKRGNLYESQNRFLELNSSTAAFKDNFYTNNFSNTINWTPIGPFEDDKIGACPNGDDNEIGAIGAILVISTNPNREYLVSTGNSFLGTGGGIFKTKDNGNNWYNTTDDENLSVFNYSAFAMSNNINSNNLIFAGISGNGNGLIYSEDAGETWKKTGLYNEINIQSGSVNYGDELWARKIIPLPFSTTSITPNQIIFITNRIIFKNNPASYEMPFTKVVYGNTHFYDAERCQSNTPSALNRIIVIGSDKLLISTDDGNSFSDLLYTSIPNFPIPTSNLGNYSFLQVDHGGIEVSNIQNNNNAIFIQLFVRYSLSGNDDILNYVFLQSTDGGATFQIMSFPTTPSTIQAHNSAVFKVAPNNPNRWYLEQTGDATVCGGGNEREIEQSNTQGDVWVSLNNMNTHGDQRALEFVSSNLNNDVLIAGNDGGVSIFENAVWTNINGNGLNISRVNNITSLEKKHESLLLGQQDGNIDFYNNGFWTNLFGGDKFKGILELNNNNAIMSKGLVNYEITGSIFKNFQGQTIPRPTRRFLGFPIYKIFNTNNEYYAMRDNFTGTGKETLSIYHSIDGGVEWNAISNANYATKPIGSANSIIISDDGNSIYYTIGGARWFQNSNVFTQNDDAGIYKITRNSNNTWQTSATNLTNNLYIKDGNPPITEYNSNFTTHNVSPLANYHSLTGVMLNPENSNELWVTLGGANKWYNTNSILSTHKVYKSVNGGSTWIDCSKGLPAVSVNCIVYQRNSGGRIFVGTDIGVFYIDNSNDNTWKYYGNNQVGVQIKELEINYCSQRIYAATWGRGVWYAPIHPRITHYSVGVNNLISASEVFNPAGDILIESGAKLTIRGALKMNRNKKITIQPGGILFVDGGSIKGNKCTEDVFWEGIEMIGEANISQPNFSTLYDFGLRQLNNIWTSQQPLCVFKNASVEDARTAVHVGKIIDGTTSYLYSGGIVIGDGATFRNNHRVAEFVQYNYRDPNNPASSAIYQSVFTNCILYGKIIKTLHRKLWLLIGGQWG